MFCNKCGKEVPDSFRFCTFCGHELQAPKQFCTACGYELSEQMAFCPQCGAKTNVPPASPPPQAAFAQQTPSQMQEAFAQRQPSWQTPAASAQQPSYQPQGGYTQGGQSEEKLKSIKNMSWLPGNPKVGVPKATGWLHLYRDRLELEITHGSNGWMAFGLVGYAISSSKGKKMPPLIFSMDQIASAKRSSYLKARSIVLQLKNGEIHTLSGSFSEPEVQECMQIIQSNIR